MEKDDRVESLRRLVVSLQSLQGYYGYVERGLLFADDPGSMFMTFEGRYHPVYRWIKLDLINAADLARKSGLTELEDGLDYILLNYTCVVDTHEGVVETCKSLEKYCARWIVFLSENYPSSESSE